MKLWYKKKREVKKLRVTSDSFLTAELKEFTEALRGEFRMSRQEVTMEGYHSLMEKKQYILDCIWANDFVLAFRTLSTHHLSLKPPPKGVEYEEMYIYHMEPCSSTQMYIYYKGNSNTEDVEFKVWKQKTRKMKKEVENSFPISVRKGMPSNE